MDNKYELMELYKEFIYTKENFVNRSFATNKFYIIAISICFIALGALKEYFGNDGSLTVMAVSMAGFAFSLLLWTNQDSYSYLLGIKFRAVIDKIEENFCFKPCIEEKNALINDKKKKRNYIFSNVQKGFSLTTMTIFLAAFVNDLIQYTMSNWNI